MNYRKSVSNGYVLGVGMSESDTNVTDADYDLITERMSNIPEAPEGKIAVLLDGTYEWEFIEASEEDATVQDYINALRDLGVEIDEEE